MRKLTIACLAILLSAAACAQDALPAPLSYDCYRTKTPILIDGKLDDPAWQKAKWTSDFVDIEGAAKADAALSYAGEDAVG